MKYMELIATFLAGGGLLKGLQLIISRKKTKLDYTEQYTAFLEKNGKNLMERLELLEKRVGHLESLSCERVECKNRITAIV